MHLFIFVPYLRKNGSGRQFLDLYLIRVEALHALLTFAAVKGRGGAEFFLEHPGKIERFIEAALARHVGDVPGVVIDGREIFGGGVKPFVAEKLMGRDPHLFFEELAQIVVAERQGAHSDKHGYS